ncbi:unnamed protein product, partial [Brachionus calyciflorus]
MASYYRRFIRNFSSITEPLNLLLRKNQKFIWTTECEKSFNNLINALTNSPILIYPNFKKDFILATDASGIGIGAILSQLDENNQERVIAYASRSLKPAERNYSATELECLAIVWAVENFRHYLYGRKFKIYSDHNPLVYLDNTKNKSARINRWRTELADYDKEIIYKKGTKNTNADALSRMNEDSEKKEVNNIDKTDVQGLQYNNQEYREKIDKIKNGEQVQNFILDNNVLFQVKNNVKRLCIPDELIGDTLRTCHNDMGGGHFGIKKTWPKIRERFVWNNMYNDTVDYVKSCKICAQRKNPKPTRAALQPLNDATYPFQMIGVDILGPLKETKLGNKYILVFTDYLSRWAEAFPIKRIDAKTIAKVFID